MLTVCVGSRPLVVRFECVVGRGAAVDRLNNPFRPGAGTQPPALIGRDELIDEFGVSLRRALLGRPDKSCMPLGLRGVGKTVLLNRFTEIARDEGVSSAFIEASGSGSFTGQLVVRLRRILLELADSPTRRAVTRALGALRSFAWHLPDGSAVSVGIEPESGLADSGMLDEDLADLLVAAGEAAAECSTGVVLAVDETQYLSEAELGALIGAVHRTAQLNLPVVVVAAGLPQLRSLAGDARTYTERLFTFPELGVLSDADARAALVLPTHDLGVEFEADALDAIVESSHGYPCFVQEWGSHAWNAAPASPITAQDVRAIRSTVIDTLDRDFFRVRFDRLTPRERTYLRAMAELGPGPHRSGDIAAVLGVQVQSAAPRRSALIAKGMIYSPAHGDTAFTVPMFDEFLRRTLPAP